MRLTLIYKGRIPSQGDSQQVNAIRYDTDLQEQLRALYIVTSPAYGGSNKQIIGSVLYTANLPVAWVCSIDILFLRVAPQANVNGLPDIDNTLKTLFDAICAAYATRCSARFCSSAIVFCAGPRGQAAFPSYSVHRSPLDRNIRRRSRRHPRHNTRDDDRLLSYSRRAEFRDPTGPMSSNPNDGSIYSVAEI